MVDGRGRRAEAFPRGQSTPYHRHFFRTEVVLCQVVVSAGRLEARKAEKQSEEIRGFSGIIFR